jgi:hypothetical protein
MMPGRTVQYMNEAYVQAGDTFETRYWGGPSQGWYTIVNEHVAFVPAKDDDCFPPYIRGKLDSCWVKYRKESRPTNKQEWQNVIHMELLPLRGIPYE